MPPSSANPTEAPARARRPAGISLLEILISMALSTLVLGGVYTVYLTCQETAWRVAMRATVTDGARAGLEQLRHDLRLVGADPSATGQPAVQTLTSGVVEFIADVDGDHVSDLVRYERDAAARTIRRTVKAWTGTTWGPPHISTVSGDAERLTFAYFPTAAVPGVQRIRVTVELAQTANLVGTVRQTVFTDIQLRNL